ncbi:MAG: serine hydrolase domain-containing protein, partial [Bacteroidales bacterium]
GLKPYITYYKQTIDEDNNLLDRWYRRERQSGFSKQVAENIYVTDKYEKKIMLKAIKKSPVGEKKYKYSGLSFMLYPHMIEKWTGQGYVDYLETEFYSKLGAETLTFHPLKKFPKDRIVPTEYDSVFRKQHLQGFVHDEGAALLGGESSNAGLFGSADDLAKLFQMYLNGGEYGGVRYIKKEVLDEFTKAQYPENDNRRGIGFDKPLLDNPSQDFDNAYPTPEVSLESYGHSGFTGTFFWIDPKNQLIYIFLSNRVNPTRDNSLIYKLNVRPSIHRAMYRSIIGTQ